MKNIDPPLYFDKGHSASQPHTGQVTESDYLLVSDFRISYLYDPFFTAF